MPQPKLLTEVVTALDACGIQYMATGSIVSSLQGEPRATHDIDLVVQIRETQIEALVEAFPASDYYLDSDAIREALSERSMFNLIGLAEGDKVDFWVLTDDPFDKSRFGRRRQEELFGCRLWISSPEDTILAKLRWTLMSGGSEKQLMDALRVYEVQCPILDQSYLDQWAEALGATPLLARLRDEAEIP